VVNPDWLLFVRNLLYVGQMAKLENSLDPTYCRVSKVSAVTKIMMALLFPVALFSCILPKKKGLYIFSSMHGFDLADNAKYLYDNVQSTNKYFITKRKNYKSSCGNIRYLYAYSIQGIFVQLFAERAYYTHGIYDFIPVLIWGSCKINLWHGVPVKVIGPLADWSGDSKLLFFVKCWFFRIFRISYYMAFDYLLCPEFQQIENYNHYFMLVKPKILVRQQPRVLYSRKLAKSMSILYAPTHRNHDKSHNIEEYLDKIRIFHPDVRNFISKIRITIVIRPHPLELSKYLNLNMPENYVLDNSIDLYDSINKYILVVTDYSSIIYDCRDLRIPYRILAADFMDYDGKVGFNRDFSEVIRKKLLVTWTDLINEMRDTGF